MLFPNNSGFWREGKYPVVEYKTFPAKEKVLQTVVVFMPLILYCYKYRVLVLW